MCQIFHRTETLFLGLNLLLISHHAQAFILHKGTDVRRQFPNGPRVRSEQLIALPLDS